jgi:hypothetical protein
MFGLAGAKYTPGMPYLDGLDAEARQRDREARKNAKERRPAKHVRTKSQRRDEGHLNRSR